MDVMIAGGLIRAAAGLMAAAPTLIVGLFIAAVFRYYLRDGGMQKLFGGESLRSLPQSWLVGMLLPVCSIGVIPIIREMRRQGIRPGAITAFALSAPLFNPLSLLYGLTLSRPMVIIGFAIGSLAVVTILGAVWDRYARRTPSETENDDKVIFGLGRIGACAIYMARELAGPTGILALIAVAGLFLLGAILPHGALQAEVEQMDPLAPLKMSGVSVFVYATPMLTMSQLGMMFDHGNSPGAAFTLLLLGTGVNLATLWWIASNFGYKSTAVWFCILFVCVVGIAYAVDRPLIPPGIEPAGHTHAFDIYTNPLHSNQGITLTKVGGEFEKTTGLADWIGGAVLAIVLLAGLVMRYAFGKASESMMTPVETPGEVEFAEKGLHKEVSSTTVGMTCLAGLVAFSIVGCYAYYPSPKEVFEEMKGPRVDVLTGVTASDYSRSLRWIPVVEAWTRRLEVGYAIRNFELRPYQQMQTYVLRKKLESLEHAIEHATEFKEAADAGDDHALIHYEEEVEEMREITDGIVRTMPRLRIAFGE
ncbi:MAG: permease [Aureliella sp.]